MLGIFGLGPVDVAILGGLGVALLMVAAGAVLALTWRGKKPPDED
jgi:hypothetical protein